MIEDIRTVVWKELLEVRRGTGTGPGPVMRVVPAVAVVAAAGGFVYAAKPDVIGIVIFFSAVFTMFAVMTCVPDSFAGERDRHTLETLLTTRLGDQAILLGKIGANVLVASAIGTICLVLSLIGSNVGGFARNNQQGVQLYPVVFVGGVVAVVLVAFLMTNLGVLVALRAPSAMGAQRRLVIAGLSLFFVSFFGLVGLSNLIGPVTSWNPTLAVALVAAFFVAANAAIFAAARSRFTRSKLVRL